MSLTIDIRDNFDSTTSLPTQKVAALRPNAVELYLFICDYDTSTERCYRNLYKCVNGVNAEFICDWQPYSGDSPETSYGRQTVSFVFSEDGTKIHAVTTVQTINPTEFAIYYGIFDLNDPTSWDNTLIYQGLIGHKYPDIVLDSRGKPVISVTEGEDGYVNLWYYDANNILRSSRVGSSQYPVLGKSTILKLGSEYYVNAGYYTYLTSRLYRFPEIAGVPSPPSSNNWSPWIDDCGFYLAQMVEGDNNLLGFLYSEEISGSLRFKYWEIGSTSMSSEEIVTSQPINFYGFGLCRRNNGYHALFKSGTGNIEHFVRPDDPGVWTMQAPVEMPDDGWGYFGMTKARNNSEEFDENWFGSIVLALTNSPYDALFIIPLDENTWPGAGGPGWSGIQGGAGDGVLINSIVFGIDIDKGAITKLTGNQNHRFEDVIVIDNYIVFNNQSRFFYFWDNFSEWDSYETYSDKIIMLQTPLHDYGNSYKKFCSSVIMEADFDPDESIGIIISNELGDSTQSIVFTNSMRNIPYNFSLLGRYFMITFSEQSNKDLKLRHLELSGFYTGAKV